MTNENLYAGASVVNSNPNATKNKISMVVLSGDMDKVMAAFLIGTGAAASGMEVTMFFTFWGFKAIQKNGTKPGTTMMGKMLAMMNRGGLDAIGPSRLNMGGMGRWMFKKMMNEKGAASLEDLYQIAVDLDVKMMPCDMTMQMMEYGMETMRDNVTEPVGVAAFIQEAAESKITLFI
jgi:peroxiredoxin family protein